MKGLVILLYLAGMIIAGLIIGLSSNKIERQQEYINELENTLQYERTECKYRCDSLKLEITKRERGLK